jgi:RHS repeat-associated protein
VKAGTGTNVTQTYSAANNRIDGYTYDALGNQLSDGSHTYKYDEENRLISVGTPVRSDGRDYQYDEQGRRVLNAYQNTEYLYDLSGHAITAVQSGTSPAVWTRGEVFSAGRHVATYSGMVNGSGGTTSFAHFDWLGTERTRTDPTGAIVSGANWTNLPFGDAGSSSANPSTLHFTGKERDSESGLDYFGARYYGSGMGRFTSTDPFTVTAARMTDPQQLNSYAYVRNNPLRHIDPTGMVIDDAACKQDMKHCGKDWQKIQDIANQKDKSGNYTHPELQRVLSTLQSDSRTFVLQNSKLSASAAGVFTITDFAADGRDFTKATLQIDFSKVRGISRTTAADLVPGFNKYQGLLDAPIYRLAETFGHEGAHALFSIDDPTRAVGIQQLLNNRDAAMHQSHLPYPPEVLQMIDAANKALVPTEQYAQQIEKIVNGELQADKKKQ